MTRQASNEIDEFVTEALRNNLVGLPLDLATINMARGRDTGVPSLNAARREFYAMTGDAPAHALHELGRLGRAPEARDLGHQLHRGVRHPRVDHERRPRSPASAPPPWSSSSAWTRTATDSSPATASPS